MKLHVICRGSKQEGLGHLLRARTFARAAAAAGHDTRLLAMVEPGLEPLLADLGARVALVQDERELPPRVAADPPDALLMDLLTLRGDVLDALRRLAAVTASLSPVFDQMPRVDALFTRIARTAPLPGVRLYAGLPYAIFGDQCRQVPENRYQQAVTAPELPVAVCMGGADAPNKTLAIVRALVGLPRPLTIWVLLGEGYTHSFDRLAESFRGGTRHEVILAKTSRSMWQVLSGTAVAILAGGLTTTEAVYAGLPSINVCDRAEQVAMLAELADLGVARVAGVFSPETLAAVRAEVQKFHFDRAALRTMRAACRGLVDLDGPSRVLGELEKLVAERRTSRRAAG